MKYMVTVIQSDGTVTENAQDREPGLDWLQKQVRGEIQQIPDFKKYNGKTVKIALANEEGKFMGMPFNRVATEAWRKYLDSTKRPYSQLFSELVGTVVIITRIK